MTIPVDPAIVKAPVQDWLAIPYVTPLFVPSESEAEAVISADAPFVTFSLTLLESVSASVGAETSNSSKSVSVIVNSALLVLPSSEVDVT